MYGLEASCCLPSSEGSYAPAFDSITSASSRSFHPIVQEGKAQVYILHEAHISITQPMRAWHISLPTATFPDVHSQYPHLRALFGLGRSSNSSRTGQGRNIATSSHIERNNSRSLSLTIPNSESGHDTSENECVVCRVESEIAMKVPTEACTHPPQVCVQCLQQVILAAISSGDFIAGILCPSYGCQHRLGYYDVQKWATEEVFERYDKLLLRDSLRTSGSYIFCVAPNCSAGQEHTGGEDNVIVTCHHCGTRQCFRHQIPWHEGLTCDQWDAQQRAIAEQHEQKTEEWIQAGTKACPGAGCGRRIQKSSGCDHMMCRRPGGCGHQFCWECLAPWLYIIEGDNSRHYDSCQYYTGLPGNNPAPTPIVAANTARLPPQPQLETAPPVATPTPSPPPPPLPPIHEFPISLQWPETPWAPWTPLRQPPSPPMLLPYPPVVTNPVVPMRSLHLPIPQQGEPPRAAIRSAWRTTELPMMRPPPGPIPQNAFPGSPSAGLPDLSRMMPVATNPNLSEMYRPMGSSASPSANSPSFMSSDADFLMGGGPQSRNAATVSNHAPSASPLTYHSPLVSSSTGTNGLPRMVGGVPALSHSYSPQPSSSSPIAYNSTPSMHWYTEHRIANTPSAASSSDMRTVTQIRNAATMKTNNSVKGASPLVAMRALQRLAETAHLKEQQGDLRGALFQFVQVGVLLQFVQVSRDYTQEVENGRQGELYQLMQEFITGPFQGMLKSVHDIQQALLREERAEAAIPSASSHMLADAKRISRDRRTGGSLADRLRQLQETSIRLDYGRPNQVPLMGDTFQTGMPTLHGPVPGPSTGQIPPHNPMFVDVGGSSSAENQVITAQKLRLCLERRNLAILMLDVRGRARFERERINHRFMVCLEPAILMRPDISAAMIEGSQATSPPTEQFLFMNRSRFDLVIMYDQDSASLGYPGSLMSPLCRGIFTRAFQGPLKRPPMVLEGGIAAWKAAVGDEGVIRGPSSSTDPELWKLFLSRTSSIEEETFLYPRATGIGYPRGDGAVPSW